MFTPTSAGIDLTLFPVTLPDGTVTTVGALIAEVVESVRTPKCDACAGFGGPHECEPLPF